MGRTQSRPPFLFYIRQAPIGLECGVSHSLIRRHMKTSFARTACVFAACVFFGTSAFAQATRTWVSGVGNDANPCSRTAPCKTFAGAISKTAIGGEIDALDPGGYGTITIT